MQDGVHKKRQNLHIRTLMANSAEGFVIVGPDGTIRVFNETAEELFGVPRTSVVGSAAESIGCAKLASAIRAQLKAKKPRIKSVQVEVERRVL
ncbi:MAG: PAS domain-containing protein, partial [Actinomycetota bacterium]|nr:PAS domain-containing protein [Actinomycetota bacterium]